ncbi:tyrosine-type recombinase/integrase [Pacificimonas sp. ICDLI1SI03]
MSIRKRSWTTKGETRAAWVVDYRDSGGNRRSKQFSRKRDAEAWMTTAAWEVAHGIHTPDSATVTVHQAIDLWLARCRAEDLERSTIRAYDSAARLHVAPLLGAEKLSKLTRPRVEVYRDSLVETRTRAMSSKALRALSSILDNAQRLGLVAQNVARDVKVRQPKRDRKRIEIPSKDDLRALISKADGMMEPLVMVAIYCGLRASELRGLPWRDVDLKKGRLRVTQRADEWGVIGSPKSDAGARELPMPPGLVQALKVWKLACRPSDLDLVFPNGAGRPVAHNNLVRRQFGPLKKLAEVPQSYGLHSLRHAAASLWIEQGLDLKRLQIWMGHSSVQVTIDTYGHLFSDEVKDQAVAAAMEAGLGS